MDVNHLPLEPHSPSPLAVRLHIAQIVLTPLYVEGLYVFAELDKPAGAVHIASHSAKLVKGENHFELFRPILVK
jgi:hypothetical protein